MVRAGAVSEARVAAGAVRCAACDAPLEPDQEWCVECGIARTTLHPTPNWRGAVAVVAIVVTIVVIVGVVALVSLTH
jgi:RNA polymerase subunit RPABC4/transcription elongation factor Spt4